VPTLWRLAREAHRELDGEGARLYGGRWNSSGRPVVYTSATLSLAALELLVHVDPEDLPDDLVALGVEVPDRAWEVGVRPVGFPEDWREVPNHPGCRRVGDEWLDEGATLVLRVPSAVVPQEENVLLNPRHPDAADVRVISAERFRFDRRLVGPRRTR
jgi:RES domain-containing protein